MGNFLFKLSLTPCLCCKLYFSVHQLMHDEPPPNSISYSTYKVWVGLLLSSCEQVASPLELVLAVPLSLPIWCEHWCEQHSHLICTVSLQWTHAQYTTSYHRYRLHALFYANTYIMGTNAFYPPHTHTSLSASTHSRLPACLRTGTLGLTRYIKNYKHNITNVWQLFHAIKIKLENFTSFA